MESMKDNATVKSVYNLVPAKLSILKPQNNFYYKMLFTGISQKYKFSTEAVH